MPINDVCIIDTNVPLTANLATSQDETEIDLECIEACIETINNVKDEKIRIALDDENEIFSEYMNKLSLSGQPGVGLSLIHIFIMEQPEIHLHPAAQADLALSLIHI